MDQHSAFAAAHSHIPWRSMRSMRNRIAHGYFDINLEVVWSNAMKAMDSFAGQDALSIEISLSGCARPRRRLAG